MIIVIVLIVVVIIMISRAFRACARHTKLQITKPSTPKVAHGPMAFCQIRLGGVHAGTEPIMVHVRSSSHDSAKSMQASICMYEVGIRARSSAHSSHESVSVLAIAVNMIRG